MKRIFTLLLFFITCAGAYAQSEGSYILEVNIQIREGNHSSRCVNKFDMSFAYDGSNQWGPIVWTEDLGRVAEEEYTTFNRTFEIKFNKRLSRIRFWGERRYNPSACNGDGKYGIDIFPDYVSTGCWTAEYVGGDQVIRYWDSIITFKIYPKTMDFSYFNTSGVGEPNAALHYLPQSHPITLKTTTGYPNATYHWQYKIGDVNDNSRPWFDFPGGLASGNSITFSGSNIDPNFKENVILKNVPVFVKIVYACVNESPPFSLIPLLSAPNYDGVEGIAPTCSYLTDGKIKVKFNRPLEDGETVSFSVNTVRYRIENLSRDQFAADNSYVMDGFPSQSNSVVEFVGRYRDYYTFTEDKRLQVRTIDIPVRPAITFTATPAAVHCFEGADGKVNVSAQGGNHQYTAFLDQNGNSLAQHTFDEATGTVFTDLIAGTYTVRLVDSQGCESRNGNGAPVTYNPTVLQPTQRVLMSPVENVEPLAFGYTDGHVTARAERGTNPYTFTWTDMATGNTLTADASKVEDNSMTSQLSNIGKGRYRVVARDSQFAMAMPATEQNIKGCYDTLSFDVSEPPLLTVSVAETHFVSCNGYTDGELLATGSGGRPYAGGMREPYTYAWYVVDDADNLISFGDAGPRALDRPSARYRVSVTDRNNITRWSDNFPLEQPAMLKVDFRTTPLLCNGDTNGIAEATPQGGTIPYRYTWSTEETTPVITNLTDGWYTVVITDARGCTTYDKTEVVVPAGLQADAVLTTPVCQGEANGSIALTVTGGAPGYIYDWSNDATTASLADLLHGDYKVTITDANGCFITRQYTLEDPALPIVNLGPDRQLCKDQTLALNPVIADMQAGYQWTKDNEPFATTANVVLRETGKYVLLVTDRNGCMNQDDVVITRTDTQIGARIAVATRVPLNGIFQVTNISHPDPDSVRWLLPAEAKIVRKSTEYVELSFSRLGEYQLGLKSFSGYCEATTYEPVRVVNASELTDYAVPAEPYIKQFMVTPNPNNGNFTATVELREAGDFSLVLYNGQGGVIDQRKLTGQAITSVDFSVSASVRGIYMLQLITAQGYSIFKVVIE